VLQVASLPGDAFAAAGVIEGAVDLGGDCGVRSPGAGYSYAGYVARLDGSGTCRSVATFDGDDVWPYALAADAAGNVYVAAVYGAPVRIDDEEAAPQGGYDAFVARYTAPGALDWVRFQRGSSWIWANAIAVLEDGDGGADVVVAGAFDGSATLDGTTLVSAADYDMLVTRYADDGALVFARSFAGEGSDVALAVQTRGTDDIIVGGQFTSRILTIRDDEDPEQAITLSVVRRLDLALIALDGQGAPRWARSYRLVVCRSRWAVRWRTSATASKGRRVTRVTRVTRATRAIPVLSFSIGTSRRSPRTRRRRPRFTRSPSRRIASPRTRGSDSPLVVHIFRTKMVIRPRRFA
jgi:hypothetical protein